MQPVKSSTLPTLVILGVSAMLCPFAAAQLSRPAPQTTSQPTSLMQQRQSRGFVARPLSLDELKLRLSKMGSLRVIASPRIKNPAAARLAMRSSAAPAPVPPRQGPGIQGGQIFSTPAQGSIAAAGSPTASARTSSKTISQSGTAGRGNAPGTGALSSRSTAVAPNQNMWGADPCLNAYKGSQPVLISVDGQSPNGFVFTPDPNHSVHVFTGCRFGNAQGKIGLLGVEHGYFLIWMNVIEGGWSDEKILAVLDPATSGLYDDEKADVRLHRAGNEFADTLSQVTFRARRTGPTLVTSVPQSLVTIFPEGSPTSMSPVPNLYGLSGSIALFRLDLTNSVLKGEDKISLNLKPGFVVDSVQIQYLVYSGNGSPSVSAPDLTHPPVIQGNEVLIDWPIFSVTQTGQSQPVFYSVYALSMWVDGPVGFKSPWANDSN